MGSAPSHKRQRQTLWKAYELWADRAHHHFGRGEAWLAGTMVTHLLSEPELRVVYFPTTPSMVDTAISRGAVGLSLLTLEDLFYAVPAPGGSVKMMPPVGALLHAYVGSRTHAPAWSAMWSSVADQRQLVRQSAGYVVLGV